MTCGIGLERTGGAAQRDATRSSSLFNYTAQLDKVIHDICARSPAFHYVDPGVIVTSWTQAKVGGAHGVYASIYPLRFEGGATETVRHGVNFRWPRVEFSGRQALYIICFLLPRFADLPYRSKLTTIFHELYHVSPECNGDLRRFPGRNFAHGHSRKVYNQRLQPWIRDYLQLPGAAEITQFLHASFAELQASYGGVTGLRADIPRPVRTLSTG